MSRYAHVTEMAARVLRVAYTAAPGAPDGQGEVEVREFVDLLPPVIDAPMWLVICSWCQRVIGAAPCAPEQVGEKTHGICPECRANFK